MLSKIVLRMPGIVHQIDAHLIELELRLAPMPPLFTKEATEALEDAIGVAETDFLCDKVQDEVTLRSLFRKVKVEGVRPSNSK